MKSVNECKTPQRRRSAVVNGIPQWALQTAYKGYKKDEYRIVWNGSCNGACCDTFPSNWPPMPQFKPLIVCRKCGCAFGMKSNSNPEPDFREHFLKGFTLEISPPTPNNVIYFNFTPSLCIPPRVECCCPICRNKRLKGDHYKDCTCYLCIARLSACKNRVRREMIQERKNNKCVEQKFGKCCLPLPKFKPSDIEDYKRKEGIDEEDLAGNQNNPIENIDKEQEDYDEKINTTTKESDNENEESSSSSESGEEENQEKKEKKIKPKDSPPTPQASSSYSKNREEEEDMIVDENIYCPCHFYLPPTWEIKETCPEYEIFMEEKNEQDELENEERERRKLGIIEPKESQFITNSFSQQCWEGYKLDEEGGQWFVQDENKNESANEYKSEEKIQKKPISQKSSSTKTIKKEETSKKSLEQKESSKKNLESEAKVKVSDEKDEW